MGLFQEFGIFKGLCSSISNHNFRWIGGLPQNGILMGWLTPSSDLKIWPWGSHISWRLFLFICISNSNRFVRRERTNRFVCRGVLIPTKSRFLGFKIRFWVKSHLYLIFSKFQPTHLFLGIFLRIFYLFHLFLELLRSQNRKMMEVKGPKFALKSLFSKFSLHIRCLGRF